MDVENALRNYGTTLPTANYLQVVWFRKIFINLVEFSTEGGGGGLPIPPKLLILYQKIKIPQTDPNALKHEINQ